MFFFFLIIWFQLESISIINLLLLFGVSSFYPYISTDSLKMARLQLYPFKA